VPYKRRLLPNVPCLGEILFRMTVKSIEAGKIRHRRLGEGERPIPTGGEEGDGQAEDGELHLPSTWGLVLFRASVIEM
jgi:hypothetical protein